MYTEGKMSKRWEDLQPPHERHESEPVGREGLSGSAVAVLVFCALLMAAGLICAYQLSYAIAG